MEWTNASEELPNDDNLKLVLYSCHGKPNGYGLSRYYAHSNMTLKMWCMEFGSTQGVKITHWVDVPSPPDSVDNWK